MSKSVKYPGFPAGANNLAPDYALPRDDRENVIFARSIVNADVLDNGDLRRRSGFSPLIAGTAIYGATSYQGAIHYVDEDTLYRQDGASATAIRSGLAQRPMAFLEVNGDLYFSNGTDTGMLRGASVYGWGVPFLENPPVVSAVGGSLVAGEYQILCTYSRADGEEGGCGPAARVTGQGFSVVAPAGETDAASVNIYATGPNDEVFRKIGTCTLGATVSFLSNLERGTELRTRFLRPMPPGQCLAHYKGRLYAGNGQVLWYSDPLRMGLCDRTKNFLLFAEDITAVVAHEDGLYVSADQTYFLAGDGPSDFRQEAKSPEKVIASYPLPDSRDSVAFTTGGMAQLAQSGQITVFDESVKIDPPTRGAVLVKEQDGLRQYIGVGFNPEHQSGAVAADFMAAEIIRRS